MPEYSWPFSTFLGCDLLVEDDSISGLSPSWVSNCGYICVCFHLGLSPTHDCPWASLGETKANKCRITAGISGNDNSLSHPTNQVTK